MEFGFFTPLYFIVILTAFFITLLMLIVFAKRTEVAKWIVCLVLVFIPFAIELIIPAADGYYTYKELASIFIPGSLYKLSVIISPFIFMWGNRFFKSSMIYFSAAVCLPLAVLSPMFINSLSTPDNAALVIQYFATGIAALLMILFGVFKMEWKDIYLVPLGILFYLAVIVFMQYIGAEIGLLNRGSDFLRTSLPNNAEQYYPDNFWLSPALHWTVDYFVPFFFRTVQFGAFAGYEKWTPVFWAVGPVFLVTASVCFVLVLINKIIKAFAKKQN